MHYMRFAISNSKLIKYQRGHMLYLCVISIAIARTTLKFNELGIGYAQAAIAQWLTIKLRPEDCGSNSSRNILIFWISAS